ncbi:MAG: HemK family protein methyltransferase [Polyangiales bacterium]
MDGARPRRARRRGARLDAELLVAHALDLRRIDLYLRFEQPLSDVELARIRGLIERRREREAVAYILGHRDFRGHRLAVDRRVLIPRPETEEVVDAALEALREFPDAVVRALDVCAGSGAIAVSLALEEPRARVDAVELSDAAAEVARANVASLGVGDRAQVLSGEPLPPRRRRPLPRGGEQPSLHRDGGGRHADARGVSARAAAGPRRRPRRPRGAGGRGARRARAPGAGGRAGGRDRE